ncbi:MAG: copper amine oxidase N-terminal domain-containing protein, partial [Thermoguttaceae bacterium]|nr:copper amine oxidase N-terminal domain-containing protein [Thermoguttaceae bacterium]
MKLHSNRRSYEKRKRLPQGEKTKNPKVMAASLASIVISAVIFCMVVVIGIVGLTSGEKVVSESTVLETEGPFHIWFHWDDNEVFYGEDASFEMSAPMIIPGDVGYFPADGIATALGGTYEYNKDKGTVKFRNIGKNVKLTVDSDEMQIGWFKKVPMDDAVYVEGETIYVPLRSFFEALGYGLTFSSETSRFDVFVPDEGTVQVPSVSFST